MGKASLNARYQIKICLYLVAASLFSSLILGVFSYTFLRVILLQRAASSPQSLTAFLVVFCLLSFLLAMAMVLLGRLLSHRSAGPIYAFRKYVNDLRSGQSYNLRFRKHDEFKEVEETASELREDFQRIYPNKELD